MTTGKARCYNPGVSASLTGLARILVSRGQFEPAARIFGAVSGIAGSDAESDARDADIEKVRAASGDEAFSAAWNDGRAHGLDAAITIALATSASPDT